MIIKVEYRINEWWGNFSNGRKEIACADSVEKKKYSTSEVAIGTWIDGKTIYRKVISISNIDAKTSSSTVELGDAPASEQNMLKIEGFVNLIGNQCFIHYPNVADEDGYINATVKIVNGKVKLSGTWKYPINKGAVIIEYLKS